MKCYSLACVSKEKNKKIYFDFEIVFDGKVVDILENIFADKSITLLLVSHKNKNGQSHRVRTIDKAIDNFCKDEKHCKTALKREFKLKQLLTT